MKSSIITTLVLVCFTWTLCGPADVFARWEDQSDELPGMDDGGTETILIVGGVMLAGIIVYLLVKASGDDAQSSVGQDGNDRFLAGGGSTDNPVLGGEASLIDQGNGTPTGRTSLDVDPLVFLQKNGVGAGFVLVF